MSCAKVIENGQTIEKYVGFADLPNQIFRYWVLRGFEFNVMVVGESGLGKSTFINSLFSCELYSPQPYSEKVPPLLRQTMNIQSSSVTITENGVNLGLTLIDTPGFGDGIDNSTCWEIIISYINSKYDEYMKWEGSSNRNHAKDTRVHACLYFISPTGHRLKPIDIEFLKRLNDKVTIIPVIAKADTLSKDHLNYFKKRIIDDIKNNGIKIYDFSQSCPYDEEDRDSVKSLLGRVPFAIVSSNTMSEINGKFCRVRKYPWGICEVENPDHSEFILLRDLLLGTSMCHLVELTRTVYYEKYRSSKVGDSLDMSLLEVLESEQNIQTRRLEDAKSNFAELYNAKATELTKQLEEFELDLKKKTQAPVDISGKFDGPLDKDSKNSEEIPENQKHDDLTLRKKLNKKKLF